MSRRRIDQPELHKHMLQIKMFDQAVIFSSPLVDVWSEEIFSDTAVHLLFWWFNQESFMSIFVSENMNQTFTAGAEITPAYLNSLSQKP